MTDGAAVVLAIVAMLGAYAARPAPVWLGGLAAVTALVVRRPALIWIGVAIAASGLAARSWSGLSPPAAADVDGTVALVGDPARVAGATVVDVVWHGRHLEAWAHGRAAAALQPRLAGERVTLSGRLQPLPVDARARAAVRHVAGRLAIKTVTGWQSGPLPDRLANDFRRTLERGAASMPPTQRALFSGFVLGDNRDEPPGTVDDFRASGLSHLLAVSGENVAFALAVAGPLLRRLGLRTRLLAGLMVLGGFGVLTRWQPSVLRAEAMSALALLAFTIGRPVSGVRLLALAVTALVLIDPLLVHSVGFGLSVGAAAGITLLAVPLSRRIPGPRPLATGLAVTASAQVGVAPVLAPVFGGIPIVTLPANLITMPAAGPVTIWGLVAGSVAGVAGGRVARVLHLPTRLLLGWVQEVARTSARAPLGSVSLAGIAVVIAALGVMVVADRTWLKRLAAVVGLTTALWPAATIMSRAPPPVDGQPLVAGARLWRAGGDAVVVLDQGSPSQLLTALRTRRVTSLSLLISTRSGSQAAANAAPVIERFHPHTVIDPNSGLAEGDRIRAGPFVVTITAADPTHLSAEVNRIGE
jgi:competence protein ComEC